MDATHIKKIKHSMLCATGVYSRDITNMVFAIFALVCFFVCLLFKVHVSQKDIWTIPVLDVLSTLEY